MSDDDLTPGDHRIIGLPFARTGKSSRMSPPGQRSQKQRRDYTAAQLDEMATNAAQGIPPAGSVADGEIRFAELSGDLSRALALRGEVKERAPDLARLARAQGKAERRAQRTPASVGDKERGKQRGKSQTFDRETSCVGKVRYGESRARHVAKVYSQKENTPLHAYPCRYCSRWHVGHVPVRSLKQ